jgi:uncharacterized protein (DUF58 family)
MPNIVLHKAENLAARLPPLLLQAEHVVHTVYQGVHGRRRAGLGDSFWQFRDYEPGDAAHRIDWRQSARTTKYYVREREWEAAQTACLWADNSGSMNYTSAANLPTKRERAELLMLALASLLLRGGERITWLGSSTPVTVFGHAGLERIAEHMAMTQEVTALPQANIARHVTAVLCSDFLMSHDELNALMRDYASTRGRGALVHILDPIEEYFTLTGRVDMRGCEGEPNLLLPNAEALREAYRARMEAHKIYLQNLASSAGWVYVRHITCDQPHMPLTQIYQRLSVSA